MQASTPPPIEREFRAVWVATVDNIDYPSKPGLPVAQMKSELLAILDKCRSLNLNAVIFQVRPSADALYASKFEPWSWYLTGNQGTAPAAGFDPLSFAVEESHKRGMELHVWCNPYRANHPAQKGPIHESHLAKTKPGIVKKYGTYLWMDPSEKDVQDRSYNVFMDLVSRYDIDGLHIDDYFYPYPVTEGGKKVDFPDAASYAAYRGRGGTLSLGDWRRRNVDQFIQRVHKGIKSHKPWVNFGISPFGIYRPGVPASIKAGIDQYDELYADALKWYQQGWCDYFTPQLYWPIAQTPQSFPVLLDWWASVNKKKIHLWPGLYTSRTNPTSGNWKATEVSDQINLIRKQNGSTGAVHFSMKAIMNNWNGIADELKKTYAKPALVPASTWNKVPAPGKLSLIMDKKMPPGLHASVPNMAAVQWFVYQDSHGALVNMRGAQTVQTVRDPNGTIYVSVMDRSGKVGPTQTVKGYRLAPMAF